VLELIVVHRSSATSSEILRSPGSSTGQSFDYIEGPISQLDTVQLDTHHGGCGFLDGEAQLSKYRAVLDHMESCALGPAESHDFIQSLIQDI
jgi:hypothetical protein